MSEAFRSTFRSRRLSRVHLEPTMDISTETNGVLSTMRLQNQLSEEKPWGFVELHIPENSAIESVLVL